MPLFDYTGQLESGEAFSGTIECASFGAAQQALAGLGVWVTSLRPTDRNGYVAPLALDDFLFFNEQVAAISKAEIPLEQGLRQLASDVASRRLKRLLLDLADDLSSGTPLESAIARQRGRFPASYAGVVQAGVRTGDLSGALYGVAAHLRIKSGVRRALVEIFTYPAVVLIAAFFVLSGVMRVILPALRDLMSDVRGMGLGNLPRLAIDGPTALFALADAWPRVEAGFAVVVAALVLGALFASFRVGAAFREWVLRRMPGVGRVYWASVLARFTHTAALGAHAALPLPEIMDSSGAASGSRELAVAARRAAERMRAGASVEAALAPERSIPALWTCVVRSTAARGELPAALAELARAYEQRAAQWTSLLRIILGPLLLLLLAGTFGALFSIVFLAFGGIIQALSF
ncbi:MAG: type II secretion system F family protein [Phycisphaerae bacterium]